MLGNVTVQPVNLKMKTSYDFIRKGSTLVSNKMIITDRNVHFFERSNCMCNIYGSWDIHDSLHLAIILIARDVEA